MDADERRKALRVRVEDSTVENLGLCVVWSGSDSAVSELAKLLYRLATMEAAVRAAERLLDGRTFDVNDPHARAIAAAVRLLEEDGDDA